MTARLVQAKQLTETLPRVCGGLSTSISKLSSTSGRDTSCDRVTGGRQAGQARESDAGGGLEAHVGGEDDKHSVPLAGQLMLSPQLEVSEGRDERQAARGGLAGTGPQRPLHLAVMAAPVAVLLVPVVALFAASEHAIAALPRSRSGGGKKRSACCDGEWGGGFDEGHELGRRGGVYHSRGER
eukprot:525397-Hanusia_phi.AAC.8